MNGRRAAALLVVLGAAALGGCGAEGTGIAQSPPPAAAGDVRPPAIEVTTPADGAAAGYLFVGAKRGPRGQQTGPLIYDDRGQAVWFKPLTGGERAYDVRVQRYRGRPVLTWWQGLAQNGFGRGEGVIYDDHYRQIASVRAGNGLTMDLHEFQLTDRGTALVLAYVQQRRDARRWGGTVDDRVIDNVVQEIDIATGRVLFEWKGLSHIDPGESYMRPPHDPAKDWDPLHLNSIEVDRDGNLLVSARDTHATYKIDRTSGRVIWRMGGKRSDFRMGPGSRTLWQHDARRLPNGNLTWFDNRAVSPTRHDDQSRGLVVAVQPRRRRVRLVRSVQHTPPELSTSQANMQTLPNGNVLLGWGGGQANLTEYGPRGRVVFEARFAGARTDSYRAYRFPWVGHPGGQPELTATAGGFRARWNGATDVASWRLLAGDDDASLRPVATVPRTGFDTDMALGATARRVQVEALDAAGTVLGRSVVATPRS